MNKNRRQCIYPLQCRADKLYSLTLPVHPDIRLADKRYTNFGWCQRQIDRKNSFGIMFGLRHFETGLRGTVGMLPPLVLLQTGLLHKFCSQHRCWSHLGTDPVYMRRTPGVLRSLAYIPVGSFCTNPFCIHLGVCRRRRGRTSGVRRRRLQGRLCPGDIPNIRNCLWCLDSNLPGTIDIGFSWIAPCLPYIDQWGNLHRRNHCRISPGYTTHIKETRSCSSRRRSSTRTR